MYVTAQQRRRDETDSLESLVSPDREIAEGKKSHRRNPCSHGRGAAEEGDARANATDAEKATGDAIVALLKESWRQRQPQTCSLVQQTSPRPVTDQPHGCYPRANYHCEGGPIPAAPTRPRPQSSREHSQRGTGGDIGLSYEPSTRLLPHELFQRSWTCKWGRRPERKYPRRSRSCGARLDVREVIDPNPNMNAPRAS